MNTENQTVQDNDTTPEPTETLTDLPIDDSVEPVTEEQVKEEALTIEIVADFLDTEEGQRLIQPILDRFFSKGLETWQKNNLERIFAEHDAEKERLANDPRLQELARVQQQIEFEDRVDLILDKIRGHKRLLPSTIAEAFAHVGDTAKVFNTIDRLVDNIKITIPILVKKEAENRFKDMKG